MQYSAAIITVNRRTLAAILVDSEKTYPAPGARLITDAQRYFPTLPVSLLSPRIGGFSRSFAHFDTTNIIKHIKLA
ncbi:hypothetical protein KW842_01880 [Duganella sp. sic0402]|uniref:hypothetical protein n=1 Tax=Duganella sp. sic0402 TaxID=2854786 RepID=UPI001C453048|nr:hypothetical protein [Duganella sp. sic0402]MBV7534506.1 hypothetical protein [Duganella sp. sic0402]